MTKKKDTPKSATKQPSAREKVRSQRAAQLAADRRRERLVRVGVGAGILVLIAAVVIAVQWQRSQIDLSGSTPSGTASGYTEVEVRKNALSEAEAAEAAARQKAEGENATAEDETALQEATERLADLEGMWEGIGVGDADAPVVVEFFEDFACPHCAEFENAGGSEALQPYLEDGSARLVFYPMTLANLAGGGNVVAANAYACVADDAGGEKAEQYARALYTAQAKEQKWTEQNVLRIADDVGVGSAQVTACTKDGTFSSWVESIGQTADEREVSSTPTVMVDGETINGATMSEMVDNMTSAIENAGQASD